MVSIFFKRALSGFMYGVCIGQTILILESLSAGTGDFYPVTPYLTQLAGSTIAAVAAQYLLTGIIGMTFAGTTAIFEVERWSLSAQTALHFAVTSAVMYVSGFLCGWFPHSVRSTIIWFGIFIAIYIIMWASFTIYYRKKTEEVNESIRMCRR